jgi:hypothetical protein
MNMENKIIFEEGSLSLAATVSKMETVQLEGGRMVKRIKA